MAVRNPLEPAAVANPLSIITGLATSKNGTGDGVFAIHGRSSTHQAPARATACHGPVDPAPPGRALNGAAQRETQRETVEAILGHRFARPETLAEALTHRSAAPRKVRGGRKGAGSNERLEFIGDRVLSLLVAEWLMERFPDEQEGELGPRLAHLVSRTVLAAIAAEARLADALAIAPNEARAGVGHLANTLADALEAALGALYLDGGLDPVRRFVRTAWAEAMTAQVLPPKDAKTALQEWLMARNLPLPEYVVAERTGPSHAPAFTITVAGPGATGTGTAGSKREAERMAAADLMGKLE